MKFVCPVCGYVEEFDGDELPADYKCPQCGCPGSRFTKQEGERDAIFGEYARTNRIVPQLIDLALLQNGLLKGEALNAFVKRSVELIG